MSDGGVTEGSVVTKNAQRSPRNIARFAQGTLLLFATSSIIAGWSGNKLATIVLTAVIVFGFMIALLGFERLARADGGHYAKIAVILITATMTAILALFATVLLYIGFGYPVALDRFFGYPTQAAPKAHIDRRNNNSVALSLTPYADPGAQIEITVYDSKGNAVGSPTMISPLLDSAVITRLDPANKYRIRIVAIVRSRPSEPLDIFVVTDARRMPIPLTIHGTYSAKAEYSGPLTADLTPEADTALLEFSDNDMSWRYQGPFRAGLPHGKGTMISSSRTGSLCRSLSAGLARVCSSECQSIEFEKGKLVRAECSISLSNAIWREKNQQINVDGAATYTGNLIGVNDVGLFKVGPYPVTFEGKGLLQSKQAQLSGTWSGGALQGDGSMHLSNGPSKVGWFDGGLLREGQVLGEPYFGAPDETMSYDVKRFSPQGAVAILRRNGFSFGIMSGADPRGPYDIGYQGEYADGGFTLTQFSKGDIWGTKYRPLLPSTSTDCQYRETFGMNVDTSVMFAKGWQIHTINHIPDSRSVSDSSPDYEITLNLKPADISVNLFRNRDRSADIRFRAGNNFAVKQEIELDDRRIETNNIYSSAQRHAALTFARMCSADKITNLTNGKTTEISNFCPAAALMLGRVYYCAPKPYQNSDSPWAVGKSIGNWAVVIRKTGNNPNSLTPVEGTASLKTTTTDLDYHIVLSCKAPNINVFGLALWGQNILGVTIGDSKEFSFSINGATQNVTLTMPRPGVFEIPSSLRQRIFDLLKTTQKLIVSAKSNRGETISFEFNPTGWADAVAAVVPTCPT